MTLPKLTNEGKRPKTMCEIYDMIEQKGIEKDREEGREEAFQKELEMFRKKPGSAARNRRHLS